MNERDSSKKGELFIVDNSDIAWKVQKILQRAISKLGLCWV
jgi:hypothetical protein